jgi:hypothetical protein
MEPFGVPFSFENQGEGYQPANNNCHNSRELLLFSTAHNGIYLFCCLPVLDQAMPNQDIGK